MDHTSRIIVLIDMDCFFCQVEENLDPKLKGKPLAVVQYNQWRGGGIIAVNYPARNKGVQRHMRGDDAKKVCPEIVLVKVPEVRGKAELSKYRDAGKRVASVLQTFTPNLERASVDEAYMDITHIIDKQIQEGQDRVHPEQLLNTFVVGTTTLDFIANISQYNEADFKLALGAVVAEEIRAEVFKLTGYQCSAGIAHNKILAKLVCGLHKPNKQTVLPQGAVQQLYQTIPVKKITGLGGKFGVTVTEKLHIEHMADLAKFSLKELTKHFEEKSARWLYNLAQGIDLEPVNTRLIAKSIGCSKNFTGRARLCTSEQVEHWVKELAQEMLERLNKDLEENNRKARQMVVSYGQEVEGEEVHSSKSHPLNLYEQKHIVDNTLKILQKNCCKEDGSYGITFFGISAGQFQDIKKTREITTFFQQMKEKCNNSSTVEIPGKIVTRSSSSDSIYSQTTEEGDDLCTDNLVYYEQVHPDKIETQDVFESLDKTNSSSDVSKDSLSNEVDFSNNQNANPEKRSFFSKYFNTNRDFDTSKPLMSVDLSEKSVEPLLINCTECGKSIKTEDYQSHQDYHYAISLVKTEAHLYKSQPASPAKKQENKKPKKRKVAEVKHKPIGEYFKMVQDKSLNQCCECGKWVSDLEEHKDYHAAKKLHLEMNVSSATMTSKTNRNPKGILNFFKST